MKILVLKFSLCLNFVLLFSQISFSQNNELPLSYYLPAIPYDAEIPTPESYLGYQIGEWHVTHDQLVGYFKALDKVSDNIEVYEYARTHENRPLFVAIISSTKNLKNKEKIKQFHQDLSESEKARNLELKGMPAILYQGYSIHGNEASGVNAAMLNAYYLVAGQSKEVVAILDNMIILVDPCLNPDGSQRFSTWVNAHKGKTLITDPNSREYSEVWPGGRYNHYWFDMNRDWLLLVHPESQGRIKLFHEWHPNVLTDHHEMGTNSTFFFQPGIPSSTNPNTPSENQFLTEEIGKYHARALDSIGSLYYTKYSFDDFYYGKGSTYPDALGSIGILFEQASSRGHLQESVNGLLSFPFTIRNQLTTSLSTQKAVLGLKDKLLNYKKGFHKNILEKIRQEPIKNYVFTDKDKLKLNKFLDILLQHNIDVYPLQKDVTINGKLFKNEESYIVPLAQSQPILAKTIFEQVKTFQDSSFYDVSSWTMSNSYGLTCEGSDILIPWDTKKLKKVPELKGNLFYPSANAYGYIIAPNQQNTHKALYEIQNNNLRAKIIQSDVEWSINGSTKAFAKGSVIISVQNQGLSGINIMSIMENIAEKNKIEIYSLSSGNGTNEITMGHPLNIAIEMPKVAIIVGNGISPQSAGEIWHHADINLGMPITMLEKDKFRNTDLGRYNTIVLPAGSYNGWGDSEINKLKEWCQTGNNIIAIGTSIPWLVDKKLVNLIARKTEKASYPSSNTYENVDKEMDARYIGGTMMEVDVDLSHPLFYGYESKKVSLMHNGTRFYDKTSNKYATPATYSKDFLVSGYLPKGIETIIAQAAAISVHNIGSGKVICFQDNPLFRGYWYGGMKMFNNAVFYGSTIDRRTLESGE